MSKEINKIKKKFDKLVGKLSDTQFWDWVKRWYDEQIILNTINNWDDKERKEEIKKMEKILEESNKEIKSLRKQNAFKIKNLKKKLGLE